MPKAKLISYLSILHSQIVDNIGRDNGRQIIESQTRNGYFIADRQITLPIEEILKETEYKDNTWITIGNRGSSIQGYNVASTMVERLFDGAPPQEIVSDFFDLINNRSGSIIHVQAMHGFSCPEAIRVSDEISVVSPENIPPTFERERIFGVDRWNQKIFGNIFDHFWMNASSAILIRSPWQYIERETREITEASPQALRWLTTISQSIPRILAALTISGNGAPTRGWAYDVPTHRAFGYRSFGHSGGGGALETPPHTTGISSPKAARQAYEMLSSLPETVWSPLSISIERLRRSRCHMDPTNRAIDLGIAIESALLHGDGGAGAKGELKNKVGTRGAWLVGKNASERIKIYEALSQAYDARSSAVHSGRLKTNSIAILPGADELCRKLLWTIAERGRYPNWKALVLGHSEI